MPHLRKNSRRAGTFARRCSLVVEPLEERALPSTFTVLNTNNSGPGSLRQAILDANASGSASTIAFDIASGGAQTITPATSLPAIGSVITLDGNTQPGFTGSPLITLSSPFFSPFLEVSGNSSSVISLHLQSAIKIDPLLEIPVNGIALDGNNNQVTGTVISGNFTDGLVISGSGNTIGGTTVAARNVIEGGISIGSSSAAATGNLLEGNYIDTDPTGAMVQGFAGLGGGIAMDNGPNTIIGGTTPGAGNVIALGVSVPDQSTGVTIQGNLIGTDASGTVALGAGVELQGSNCTLGGSTAAARNVIFNGNPSKLAAVVIDGGATNELVEGNLIGTQIDGTDPLTGLSASNYVTDGIDVFGKDDTIVGNTIAYSGLDTPPSEFFGVGIDVGGMNNRISQNVMFDNQLVGIEFANTLYTPNGANPGTGPNNSQNFPVLTSATVSGGQTVITGMLSSQADTQYTLEFFAAADKDPGDFVEGRTFLGSKQITTDATGNATFSFAGPANPGPFYTATATDPSGNTSTFWQPDVATPTITGVTFTGLDNTPGIRNILATITGSNFFTTSSVQASTGALQLLQRVNRTTIQTSVSLAADNAVRFTVTNPGPGNGTSNSFTLTVTSSQRFVAGVYQNLLGRDFDRAGLDAWTALLDSGQDTPSQIVAAIETSTEYRSDQVQALYQRYLHRAADATGLANDTSFLQNGGTVEQVAAGILGSREFFQIQGGGTKSGFLNALYQDALNRAIDSAGQASWLQAFANGARAVEVAGAVLTSLEYRQDLVESFYGQFLNRPADSAGLSSWVNSLKNGARDETVVAGILGSPEYDNNPFVP
jgi:hypothetical protein